VTNFRERIRPSGWISDGFSTVDEDTQFKVVFHNVERYLRYLAAVRDRAVESASDYRDVTTAMRNQMPQTEGRHPMPLECLSLLQTSIDLTRLIQSDTESFYLFARILQDRVWDLIQFCFWSDGGPTQVKTKPFRTNFMDYAEKKNLTVPSTFLAQSKTLLDRVSRIRDEFIVHPKSAQTLGMTTINLRDSALSPITQFARNEEHGLQHKADSEDLHVLFDIAKDFVNTALIFVESNTERLRFRFDPILYDSKLAQRLRPFPN